MNKTIKTGKVEWDRLLELLSGSGDKIYAPLRTNGNLDYDLVNEENIKEIVYNQARPSLPLKVFFLPVRLNVSTEDKIPRRTIVIGAPSCDIEGLKLLDAIYVDAKYSDETYLSRRKSTIIIGSACYKIGEHCHCTAYEINPWPGDGCDISLDEAGDSILLTPLSGKGTELLDELKLKGRFENATDAETETIRVQRETSVSEVKRRTNGLPGRELTAKLVAGTKVGDWKRFSSKCVSCGACSAICPTCTCFLLIDKPGFEKIKQQDTCQYPAFERVAGGEDPLKELSIRFSNRYMCKYVWKPERFKVVACTGCGRCTDACIAGIDKNEVIREMV
jgi:sulfhydrogenase subunit beta (sulfur reductase)